MAYPLEPSACKANASTCTLTRVTWSAEQNALKMLAALTGNRVTWKHVVVKVNPVGKLSVKQTRTVQSNAGTKGMGAHPSAVLMEYVVPALA